MGRRKVKRFIMVAYQVDPSDPSFTQVLDRILFNTAISMGARLTYAALVEHYRDNSSCWPSMERLASMVGCCARTIQNHIKELITGGLVTVIKRGCWKRANEYRLHALVPPRESSESQPKDIRNRVEEILGNAHPTNHIKQLIVLIIERKGVSVRRKRV
jgi:DNA-binding transcriptional regulator YhcF (GntR family)